MSETTRPQRPPLAERLKASLEEALEWAKNERAVPMARSGETPVPMTRAEWEKATGHTQTAYSLPRQDISAVDVTKYKAVISWSEEEECFIAEIPELRGCNTDGETQEEALANLRIVAQEWIEIAAEEGIPIPLPMAVAVEIAA